MVEVYFEQLNCEYLKESEAYPVSMRDLSVKSCPRYCIFHCSGSIYLPILVANLGYG